MWALGNGKQFETKIWTFFITQVIAGLLVPIYIKKLDFKTREELQQMPQTEEEHLENQYLDYEDKEKSIADAEVNFVFLILVFRSESSVQYQ